MDPKNNPHSQQSNADQRHSPEKGATIPEQQANAAREVAGKSHLPPTSSPASAKQTSANLVQTHGVFGGFSEPAADGKSTGEFTIHIVRQPNDSRSEAAIVFAALQDEFEKAKAGL